MTTTETKHTPGPWGWEYYDRNPNRAVALSAGSVDVLLATGTGSAAWAEVSEADQRLIAAAPDMLAELRETADWLDGRAKVLREIADDMPTGRVRDGKPVSPAARIRQGVLDEAARIAARALLIRQTITKATQGA